MKDLLVGFRAKLVAMTALLVLSATNVLFAQKVAIIDAGSSGSRLYVYNIGDTKVDLLYPIGAEQKAASKGRALSSIVNHEDSVRVFLESMTAKYRGDDIDLYVLATAGMRLKPKAHADSIYDKMKSVSVNGYEVQEAMTISGQYEGLYGWLAANYDAGKLKISTDDEQKTLMYTSKPCGILEIGGASMQLAFQSEELNADCLVRPGLSYIYSKSYLGGGVDQIFQNTKKGKRGYKFHLDLKNVSKLYGPDASFWGLGIPVNRVLEGIDAQTHKNSYRQKIKAYIRSLNDYTDTKENYHPRINSHYVKWVSHHLKLDEKLESPEKDSSWTMGAAIDIMVYKEAPEEFDHQNHN